MGTSLNPLKLGRPWGHLMLSLIGFKRSFSKKVLKGFQGPSQGDAGGSFRRKRSRPGLLLKGFRV